MTSINQFPVPDQIPTQLDLFRELLSCPQLVSTPRVYCHGHAVFMRYVSNVRRKLTMLAEQHGISLACCIAIRVEDRPDVDIVNKWTVTIVKHFQAHAGQS